jgi:DNA-binding NtrC family response regulator
MAKEPGIPIFPESSILILDDDESLRVRLQLLLARVGLANVVATGDRALASALVADRRVDLVLLDLFLPDEAGEGLLLEFSRSAPETPVIVMTSSADPQTIVRCMRLGAVDYVVKPLDEVRFMVSIWNVLDAREIKREAAVFRMGMIDRALSHPEAFEAIVTSDHRMRALFAYIESVARSRQPVLITGETGTGKELFARAVHAVSGRKGAFVAVNVGGLDDTMFSDCLFGHRKGAYTGADGSRAGMLKEAQGGTILLDEIGELEQRSQIKLLRLLQENEYYPLGSDSPSISDARVVAATTKDLKAAAAEGSFRSDLFYRLQTHPIAIPPLRSRRGDIPLLARHFLEKSALALGMEFSAARADECAKKIASAVGSYGFPGNVRELEALVHDAVAGSQDGKLDLGALAERIGPEADEEQGKADQSEGDNLASLVRELSTGKIPTMDEAEHELALLALERSDGNMSKAALLLGISRQTLYNKLRDTKLKLPEEKQA